MKPDSNHSPFRAKAIKCRNPEDIDRKDYIKAYELWHKEWTCFWKNLAGLEHITADAFLKQDEMVAVFYEDQCIALSLFTAFDLSLEANRHDNYFESIWIPSFHQKLNEKWVWAGSHITTDRAWRRNSHGFSLKDLLVACCILRFWETPHRLMIGAMRNNRGVNDLAYRFGAEKFGQTYNELMTLDLDLVIFEKDKIHLGPDPLVREIAFNAWPSALAKVQAA